MFTLVQNAAKMNAKMRPKWGPKWAPKRVPKSSPVREAKMAKNHWFYKQKCAIRRSQNNPKIRRVFHVSRDL